MALARYRYAQIFQIPASSENVLAFWSYDWFTLSGKTPYLMMPNTGGDPYSNTGRDIYKGDSGEIIWLTWKVNTGL